MIGGPINFTGYDREQLRAEAELQTFHQPRKRTMAKIHLVKVAGQEKPRLVKAHTRAGAEKYVRDSIKPAVTATVASQQELVDAIEAGIKIENATAQGDLAAQGELE